MIREIKIFHVHFISITKNPLLYKWQIFIINSKFSSINLKMWIDLQTQVKPKKKNLFKFKLLLNYIRENYSKM